MALAEKWHPVMNFVLFVIIVRVIQQIIQPPAWTVNEAYEFRGDGSDGNTQRVRVVRSGLKERLLA